MPFGQTWFGQHMVRMDAHDIGMAGKTIVRAQYTIATGCIEGNAVIISYRDLVNKAATLQAYEDLEGVKKVIESHKESLKKIK